MKAYKGTDKDMKCRGYQFELGKEYLHEGTVELCHSGFHACENPLDVLSYYSAADKSRYFKVECAGDVEKHDSGSKIACSKITFNAEIGIMGLVKAGVAAVFERVTKMKPDQYSSGYQSTAATSGYQSTAATSGYQSTAATSGSRSTAATSGDRSTAATSGDRSTAATSGDRSTAATSGSRSTAATSGYQSTAATSGDRSTAATSGSRSTAIATGTQSIAIANGYEAKAQAPLGGYISITEYNEGYELVDYKCAKVDGKKIKPDTLYMLKNGKFVKAYED